MEFDSGRTLREYGVSSLSVYQFASAIEAALHLEIPDEDFRPEHFATLGDIERLIARIVRD